jgi:hypothetical protein
MVSDQNTVAGVPAITTNGSAPRGEHLVGLPVVLARGGIGGEDGVGCLPAPLPEMVRAARAYLTPRCATGVDAFLWEIMEHPCPTSTRSTRSPPPLIEPRRRR